MGNCRVQFIDGEEQKLEVGQLGNDAHEEIRTLTGEAPRSSECTIDLNTVLH
jgi:hypothetical protein